MNVRKRKKNIKRKMAAGQYLTNADLKFCTKYKFKNILFDYVFRVCRIDMVQLRQAVEVLADGIKEFVTKCTTAICQGIKLQLDNEDIDTDE